MATVAFRPIAAADDSINQIARVAPNQTAKSGYSLFETRSTHFSTG
jgi:hypothetical protein